MLRGTRILTGDEAREYTATIDILRGIFIDVGYEEIVVPAIWHQQTFIDKTGPEIVNQMWAFHDKKKRPVCLIPEATGLIQEVWRNHWAKQNKSRRIFYVQRCYRYERPQAGRYREFTQFGVELLGAIDNARTEAVELLRQALDTYGADYRLDESVKRGLSYYTEDGFEAICENLGAQKQIAGGGRYVEGVGWAIGVERLMLAVQRRTIDAG